MRALYKAETRVLSRLLRTPQYLILFLSDSCWMRCNHCWFNEEWKETHLKQGQLTFDELSRLADSIHTITFLSLTGGEAFARRDVVEIAEMFAKKTKLRRYQIPTSGYKPDLIEDRAERMLRANPRIPFRVDVSLDGNKEVHERVRMRPGVFANALETVARLRRLKTRHSEFDVGMITTISSFNQHQVDEISRIVEEANPDGEWMVNIVRGNVREPCSREVDPANYWRAHELIEERIESGRYEGHSGHVSAKWLSAKNAARRKIIHDTLLGQHRPGGCAAGALGGVIYSDGTVQACEMLEAPLGNVRDFDFDLPALWNSPRADEVRAMIQDMRCHCTQECFLSVSMLIQPGKWGGIVRERLRLRRGAGKRPTPSTRRDTET